MNFWAQVNPQKGCMFHLGTKYPFVPQKGVLPMVRAEYPRIIEICVFTINPISPIRHFGDGSPDTVKSLTMGQLDFYPVTGLDF